MNEKLNSVQEWDVHLVSRVLKALSRGSKAPSDEREIRRSTQAQSPPSST